VLHLTVLYITSCLFVPESEKNHGMKICVMKIIKYKHEEAVNVGGNWCFQNFSSGSRLMSKVDEIVLT